MCRGFDVYRVLVAVLLVLIPGDKIKQAHLIRQLRQRKAVFLSCFKIEHFKSLEIGKQDVTRRFAVFERKKVIRCLVAGLSEAIACGLLFDKQMTRPEKIKKALVVIELFNLFLV